MESNGITRKKNSRKGSTLVNSSLITPQMYPDLFKMIEMRNKRATHLYTSSCPNFNNRCTCISSASSQARLYIYQTLNNNNQVKDD